MFKENIALYCKMENTARLSESTEEELKSWNMKTEVAEGNFKMEQQRE